MSSDSGRFLLCFFFGKYGIFQFLQDIAHVLVGRLLGVWLRGVGYLLCEGEQRVESVFDFDETESYAELPDEVRA